MVYLASPSAEMSRLRVTERVAHGGHNIPEKDIIRRFPRSLYNLLNLFTPQVNQTLCNINSSSPPELVFQQDGVIQTIFNPDLYWLLQEISKL